jgi:hypothetical protein
LSRAASDLSVATVLLGCVCVLQQERGH